MTQPSLRYFSVSSRSPPCSHLPEVFCVCFLSWMLVFPATRPQPGPFSLPARCLRGSLTTPTRLSPLLHTGSRSCCGSSGSSTELPSALPLSRVLSLAGWPPYRDQKPGSFLFKPLLRPELCVVELVPRSLRLHLLDTSPVRSRLPVSLSEAPVVSFLDYPNRLFVFNFLYV